MHGSETTDNAYVALTEEHSGSEDRWAFGTGFSEALAGVDTTIPGHVNRADLSTYCLMLGDDALVLSQRLIEWCTDAPELEEEVALANIALDLLGQARLLLARSGVAEGIGRDEDTLAYFRDAEEFRNVVLAEVPGGDFGRSVLRLLVVATWRLALFRRLVDAHDPVLAAIAARGVNECTYHAEYAAAWTVRLGDGTDYSHERMLAAVADVDPHYAQLFRAHPVEKRLAEQGVATDPATLREEVGTALEPVLDAARLDWQPTAAPGTPPPWGRDGQHTPGLSELLTEMQSVARAHPNARW
ncbi:1,2-phenylacetyl-CoA epoxidase subunit PaaC [Lipingzhangella sp. LS1_29]|uniref:1,2-phenylacetyl-CoA epoxidase subunit PaaC n=1 Tax=Lipingzhangella rawalii TaxID=2055835 RepID=A0ABU2H7Y6_9ACTN|nr:1,2-phenylacetyl-CoA epoxidase subunit PaaC [Lipingzhangella rawalii]MDS1271417.1 1,2-phenylacetyl-CoA epoxidase subunit PaaC [Lipingzhangella rawalii]